MNGILRPDGFAISLFLLGGVMLFVPLMVTPALVAIFAAFAYWLTMAVVKVMLPPRSH